MDAGKDAMNITVPSQMFSSRRGNQQEYPYFTPDEKSPVSFGVKGLFKENVPKTLGEVFGTLATQLKDNEQGKTLINAVREAPMDGLLNAIKRPSFDLQQRLDVQLNFSCPSEYTTEGAIDTGGPTRELLRLVMEDIKEEPLWDKLQDGTIQFGRDSMCKFSNQSVPSVQQL